MSADGRLLSGVILSDSTDADGSELGTACSAATGNTPVAPIARSDTFVLQCEPDGTGGLQWQTMTLTCAHNPEFLLSTRFPMSERLDQCVATRGGRPWWEAVARQVLVPMTATYIATFGAWSSYPLLSFAVLAHLLSGGSFLSPSAELGVRVTAWLLFPVSLLHMLPNALNMSSVITRALIRSPEYLFNGLQIVRSLTCRESRLRPTGGPRPRAHMCITDVQMIQLSCVCACLRVYVSSTGD